MANWIRHYVNDMEIDELKQRCIFCGEVISDHTNMMWPKGSPPPQGFSAGHVFVYPGNPQQLVAGDYFDPEKEFTPCQ